jgi:hypothetical protein
MEVNLLMLEHPEWLAKQYQIYALIDPHDQTTRYVGVSNDVKRRYYEHLQCIGVGQQEKRWIKELAHLGLSPLIQILETIQNTSKQREVALAAKIRISSSVGIAAPTPPTSLPIRNSNNDVESICSSSSRKSARLKPASSYNMACGRLTFSKSSICSIQGIYIWKCTDVHFAKFTFRFTKVEGIS